MFGNFIDRFVSKVKNGKEIGLVDAIEFPIITAGVGLYKSTVGGNSASQEILSEIIGKEQAERFISKYTELLRPVVSGASQELQEIMQKSVDENIFKGNEKFDAICITISDMGKRDQLKRGLESIISGLAKGIENEKS